MNEYFRLAAMCALVLAGCSTAGGWSAWPVVEVNERAAEHATDVDLLGGLWRFSADDDERRATLAPLFNYHRRENQDLTKFQLLWPLIQYRRSGDDQFALLFPLFYHRQHVQAGGAVDRDWAILPLVFGGNSRRAGDTADPSADEGEYLFVLPFGGTLKGLLGKKQITMVSFFYYQAEDMFGYRTWAAPWPFVSGGEGNGKSAFAVWPFYSGLTKHDRETGALKYRRFSVLWPLIHWQDNAQDTAHPESMFAFWPFYMRRHSDVRENLWVLFPLFERHTDDRQTEDEDGNTFTVQRRGWSALWPLIGADRGFNLQGDELSEFRLLPFYWHKKDARKELTWLPFPLGLHTRYEDSDGHGSFTHDNWGFYPLVWWGTRDYAAQGTASSAHFKLFPLAGYRRVRDEFTHFEVLSPIPVVIDDDFDRNWGWLWRLFEYRQTAGEETLVRALGPVFKYRRTPETTDWHFLPLASYQSDDERDTYRFDLLWGLFGTGRNERTNYLRLFWGLEIPTGARAPRGDDDATDRRRRRLAALGAKPPAAGMPPARSP